MITTIVILSVIVFMMFVNNFFLSSENKKANAKYSELALKVSKLESLKQNTLEHSAYKEKYESLVNEFNKLKQDSKLRKGYYKSQLTFTNINKKKFDFDVLVYVKELDKYKNGKSKIEFLYIDIIWTHSEIGPQKENVTNYVRNHFESLVDSTKIEWLESEEDIKEIRKNKMKHLSNMIEQNNKEFENLDDNKVILKEEIN